LASYQGYDSGLLRGDTKFIGMKAGADAIGIRTPAGLRSRSRFQGGMTERKARTGESRFFPFGFAQGQNDNFF
jgi:hypothetical protein